MRGYLQSLGGKRNHRWRNWKMIINLRQESDPEDPDWEMTLVGDTMGEKSKVPETFSYKRKHDPVKRE